MGSEIILPKLVAMVGFPRAGKSTWVQSFYVPRGYAVVSPDMLRKVIHGKSYIQAMEHYVWSVVYCMADSLLAYNCRVVVDGTHISHRQREEWVIRGAVFHYVSTPPEICLERARGQSNACDIVPVIEHMIQRYEPLSESEGEIQWSPPTGEMETVTTPPTPNVLISAPA